MVTFPAGAVAALRWGRTGVQEGPWLPALPRLALRHGAAVLPVHFAGRNSALFQSLGLLHPALRTAWLPREAGRRGRRFRVTVGFPLGPAELRSLSPASDLAAALRRHTLALEPKASAALVKARRPLEACPGATQLASEAAALALRGRALVDEGAYQVLWFRRHEAPALMRAVAVGREATFREAGEGTGAALDEDIFDGTYDQVILWDRGARAVAGGYRAVQAAGRWERPGPDGLYTATLFDLDPRLGADLEEALELGRSFIAAPWQRQALPLLLLWRGVGAYALRVAGRQRLFGCVSISPRYATSTQRLLLRFLAEAALDPVRAGWAHPRNEPRELLGHPGPRPEDLRGLERWVAILEQGQASMPPLLKHYLTLGARVLAFNRDPAFNGTVDALIMLDLTAAPRPLLRRYLSPEDLARLATPTGKTGATAWSPECAR